MGKPYREYTPEDIYNMRFEITTLTKQLDQLKGENENLKYKAEFFENYNNAHINKITKLEKTLTEIKEYCTDMKKDHYWGMRMMRFANEILQKISKCEVEDV